jgi:drug/metabolite transporter (DMT)-like permease
VSLALRLGPIAAGVVLALASATAFGITIPLLAWAGVGVGPNTTAGLLYLGASLASLVQRLYAREAGAPVTRRSLAPLLVMAVAGAAVAPTLLAWGIQRAGPVTGGLMLNLEAVWTVVLARIVFREFLGTRAVAALVLMTAGGVLLSVPEQAGAGGNFGGAVAVLGATVAWAIDNTASRRVAELRTLTVVGAKGGLGATMTLSLAVAFGESMPERWRALVLVVAGATGYGLSLRLYLLAQRRIGSARTASVFALAPFIGAAIGLAMVPTQLEWATAAAGLLFAVGVVLHLSERHGHLHRHEATSHEHPHHHEDGHHTHLHDPPLEGEHSHPHRHEALQHTHEHGQDVHHGHAH